MAVLLDQAGDLVEFVPAEVPRPRQRARAKPEFRVSALFGHMDVHGFAAVKAEEEEEEEEEETIPTHNHDVGHASP
jgi:hypothetical protein